MRTFFVVLGILGALGAGAAVGLAIIDRLQRGVFMPMSAALLSIGVTAAAIILIAVMS